MEKEKKITSVKLDLPEGYVNSKRIIGLFRWHVDDTVISAHKASDLVLRKVGRKWYLATFVHFFNNHDIEYNVINRPTQWFLLDLLTGKLVQAYGCEKNDFSNASFNAKYSMEFLDKSPRDISREYYREVYSILDAVRLGLLHRRKFDEKTYQRYLTAFSSMSQMRTANSFWTSATRTVRRISSPDRKSGACLVARPAFLVGLRGFEPRTDRL